MSLSKFCLEQREKENKTLKVYMAYGLIISSMLHLVMALSIDEGPKKTAEETEEPIELVIVNIPEPKVEETPEKKKELEQPKTARKVVNTPTSEPSQETQPESRTEKLQATFTQPITVPQSQSNTSQQSTPVTEKPPENNQSASKPPSNTTDTNTIARNNTLSRESLDDILKRNYQRQQSRQHDTQKKAVSSTPETSQNNPETPSEDRETSEQELNNQPKAPTPSDRPDTDTVARNNTPSRESLDDILKRNYQRQQSQQTAPSTTETSQNASQTSQNSSSNDNFKASNNNPSQQSNSQSPATSTFNTTDTNTVAANRRTVEKPAKKRARRGGLSWVRNCRPKKPSALGDKEGRASVRVSVDANGNVVNATIARASGDNSINQQALAAARKMKFRAPGTSVTAVVTINFTNQGSNFDRRARQRQRQAEQERQQQQQRQAELERQRRY